MYHQLDRSRNQIRLLRLFPGSASDDIMCDLFTVSIDERNVYEAVSYVWGWKSNLLPIVVDGQRKDVTENLESVLRHLRNDKNQRILWVDALCINQDDLDERSSQVQLMGRIYADASQVVAWLGSTMDSDEKALDMIRRLGSDPRLHWTDIPMKRGEEFVVLYMCLRTEWWSRIWTAQEAVLAKRITYQLGMECVSDRLLSGLATSFREHVHRSGCCNILRMPERYGSHTDVADDLKRIMDDILQLRQLQLKSHNSSFDQVASLLRHRRATQPLDKVYGLLGITCGIAERSIDYTLSKARVYELTARDCMAHNNNLNILSHVIHYGQASSVELADWSICWEKDMPSWVPDWTIGDTDTGKDVKLTGYKTMFLHYYNACGALCYNPVPNDQIGKLHANGVRCDSIATVSGAILTSSNRNATDEIKDWRSMAGIEKDPSRTYVGGDTVSEAFWRVLCLDVHVHPVPKEGSSIVLKRADAEDRELYFAFWYFRLLDTRSRTVKESDHNFVERLNVFSDHVQTAIARRRFFVSQKGYMGLAPLGTEPGDTICVLAGGRVPLIVRAVPRNDGEASNRFVCRLMGDAYVHGLMDGEAMKLVDDGVLKVEDFELI